MGKKMKSNNILIILTYLTLLIGLASAQIIPLWGKCAGVQGSLGQCVSGSYCQYQDAWYSQCVPGTGTTRATSTANPTTQSKPQPQGRLPYGLIFLNDQFQFIF